MRPVRLVMRAFGPFAGEQVIDFRELGERAFFLVHGPTGAGKTTVLDAICFGLYGESTGDLRQPDHFRSTHADPQQETEVVFDFSLGREQYRVQRRPAQERAKKRGSGTTKIAAESTLWRRTGCRSDTEEGVPLATQPTKVTDQVKSLLGFESAQFRQVVVLPQGEFRRLLVADSKDREAILEQLFDVARYQSVQDVLKRGAEALRHDYERRRDKRATLLEQAGAESVAELTSRLEAVASGIEAARAEQVRTTAAAEAARLALEAGRTRAGRLEALRDAEVRLAAHGERSAEFANERARLDAALRAEPVLPIADAASRRGEERRKAAKEAEAAQRTLEGAAGDRDRAGQALEGEQARAAEREDAALERQRLEEIAKGAEDLRAAREALAGVERTEEESRKSLDALREKLESARGETEKGVVVEREATAQAAQLDAAVQRTQRAESRLANAGALGEKRRALNTAEEERTAAATALAAAERAVSEAVDADALLREAARLGRAVMLARELVSGDPCPVCGAADHPAPASAAHAKGGEALKVPDDESLRRAERALDASRTALQRSQVAHSEAESRAVGLRAEVETLDLGLREGGALPAEAEASSETRQAHFEAELDAARKVEQAARAAQGDLERIARARGDLEREIAGLRSQEKELEPLQREAASRLGACRGIVQEHEQRIAEALRAPGAVEAALRDARARERELTEALEKARKAANDADVAFSKAEATEAGERKRSGEAQALLEREQAALATALDGAGFADLGELSDARLEVEARGALEQRIRDYAEAGERLEGELGAARSAADGVEAPDLQALDAADEAARSIADAATLRLGELGRERSDLVRLERQLGQLGRDLDALDERHQTLGRLAEVATGSNPRRLTFQRFVLAAFLDEVLELASDHLRQMTNGRFALHRAIEVRDKRAQSGLDLVVNDSYSGDDRPVATLSGGESFLAALALALGLADVVQRHAGGIHLEAIFIDEGFGSLDSQSLDLAISTLIDLESGGRMVGVISHVSELRERISTRLELSTDRSGSHAEFIVG